MNSARIPQNGIFALAALTCLLCALSADATTYHVATNGNDVASGLDWANAVLTISNAVSKATSDGDVVMVSNGVYSVTNQIAVTNAITVQGTNGAAVTILTNPGSGNRFFEVIHSNAVIVGFTLTGAYLSADWGSAIRLGSGKVLDCVISNNTTWGSNYGGAIAMQGKSLVSNCLIAANTGLLSNRGGGLNMEHVDALVVDCIISNNAAGTRGGGVYMNGGGTVRNCLIVTNSIIGDHATYYGGGLALLNDSHLENCTIANNVVNPLSPGAGVFLSGAAATIRNCIVYHNMKGPFRDDISGSQTKITFSCAMELVNGVNNNSADDPDFVDHAAFSFDLLPGSPCIDTGTNLATVPKDINGVSRPVGSGYDMGCYEVLASTSGAFRASFVASTNTGFGTAQVVLTSSVSGTNTSGLTYHWDFDNDGTYETNGAALATVTNTFSAGSYDIKLIVSNAVSESYTRLKYNYIVVSPSQMYVSSSGSHTSPFDTWGKAATNLAAAVALDADTVTITVGDGTYAASDVVLDNVVILNSLNGADATRLQNSSSGSRLLQMTVAGVLVDGLTLAGSDFAGAGSAIWMTGGTVQNCTVISNSATGGGGNGAIYAEDSSVISNCLVAANSGSYVSGGVALGGSGCLMVDCIVSNNNSISAAAGVRSTLASSGTIRNCLISHNYLTGASGGYYGAGLVPGNNVIVENCTIVHNRVPAPSVRAGVSGASSRMTNCIVYHNTQSGSPSDLVMTTTYGNIGYTCAPEVSHGVNGNVTNAPLFVDTNALDYTLQNISPCRNSGIQIAWMAGGLDLAGNKRLVGPPDMGAYEWQPAGGTVITIR